MDNKMVHLHVVDDEKDLQTIFRLIYKKEIADKKLYLSFSINGKECIDFINNSELPVDYVLTDINMPEMNGIELIQILNKEFTDLKVFVASAYDSEQYTEQLKDLSIEGFITKPINFAKLKTCLGI